MSFSTILQDEVLLLWDFRVALISLGLLVWFFFSVSRSRLPEGNRVFASDFSEIGI